MQKTQQDRSPFYWCPHCCKAESGFTLVELMVVVGIMGLMLVFAIPAFNEMNRGAAMRSAEVQVRSTLSLARQYAALNNQSVRFIIAGAEDSGGNLAPYTQYPEHVDKCLRAYAVYDFGENQLSSAVALADDRYVKDWEYLPPGIVFDNFVDAISHNGRSIGTVLEALPYANPPVQFPRVPSSHTRQMAGVTYTPEGKARFRTVSETIQTATAIVLAEGFTAWPANGSINPDDPNQYQLTSGGMRRALIVYDMVGRVESVELPNIP